MSTNLQFGKHDVPAAILSQHLIVLGKTGAGKSSVLRLLVESLLRDQKPVCIIDPKGDWWGLKSSADGKLAGYPVVIFGGDHADVPLNPHAGAQIAELVATGNRPCIIDVGMMTMGERTRFFIDFAAGLFRCSRGPRWLIIDEVHNFAPQGKVLDPDAGKMLHWANRLASEGRGKGIQLIAASQRPQKVHKDFVTSCETLIAMRVIHPLDRGAIKEWIDGCPDRDKGREVLESLASMPRGTGWAWSPEIGFGPQRIAFPLFQTYDSFKAPTGEAVGKLKGWAEVDLDDVKRKLSEVVEEAKANDPKLLRKRIAELEDQIASNRVAEPEVEVQRVEVPVLADAQIARLEGAVTAMSHAGLEVSAAAAGISQALLKAQGVEPVPSFPMPARSTAPPAPAATTRRNTAPSDAGNGTMSKAERAILMAIAQRAPKSSTRPQASVLSGYSVTSSSFSNALGALRSKGYLDGQGDDNRVTKAGVDALGHVDPLPTGKELVAYWMSKLGKAERSFLSHLADRYPREITKEALSQATGYSITSSSFANALGKLRTLELITGRNELRASADLFDGGRG